MIRQLIIPNKPMHYPAWIAPNGDLYSCPDGSHYELSRLIVKDILNLDDDNPEKRLESLNWLKVNRYGNVLYYLVSNVTQKQVDTLISLLNHVHEIEPPDNIKMWKCGGKYVNGTAESWQENLQSAIKLIGFKFF